MGKNVARSETSYDGPRQKHGDRKVHAKSNKDEDEYEEIAVYTR
jgi:hypothetical protein